MLSIFWGLVQLPTVLWLVFGSSTNTVLEMKVTNKKEMD